MWETNQWRVPLHLLERWLEEDRRVAQELYGVGSHFAKPHHFPCLATSTQVRKGSRYIMMVLGVAVNRQGTVVFDGPDGSDLPNGKRGDSLSIGNVYTATSSATTRTNGDSNTNGWMLKVHNCAEMELRVLRPVENGPGIKGVSNVRLRWMAGLWSEVRNASLAMPENKALAALFATLTDATAVFADTPVPSFFTSDADAYRLWRGLLYHAKSNEDKKVRRRTAERPRQVKRSSRPRKHRLAVGTAIPVGAKVVSYEGSIKVDAGTGSLSVFAKVDTGRRRANTMSEIIRERVADAVAHLSKVIRANEAFIKDVERELQRIESVVEEQAMKRKMLADTAVGLRTLVRSINDVTDLLRQKLTVCESLYVRMNEDAHTTESDQKTAINLLRDIPHTDDTWMAMVVEIIAAGEEKALENMILPFLTHGQADVFKNAMK